MNEETDGGWVMPAVIGAAVGASIGYAVRGMQSRAREARAAGAEVDGYRRGLQDGHNRLAARQARKARVGRLTAPRRDTIPEGI